MAYVSTIERFGMERGFKQGIEQGMQQGKGGFLMDLLKYKFHNIPENYHQRLSAANSEELLHWGKRVLTAESLEEVFE